MKRDFRNHLRWYDLRELSDLERTVYTHLWWLLYKCYPFITLWIQQRWSWHIVHLVTPDTDPTRILLDCVSGVANNIGWLNPKTGICLHQKISFPTDKFLQKLWNVEIYQQLNELLSDNACPH